MSNTPFVRSEPPTSGTQARRAHAVAIVSAPTMANEVAIGRQRPAGWRQTIGRAVRAVNSMPMPSWVTPVAIASLAMYIVQSLDHGVFRIQPVLALVIAGSLATVFVALYFALTRPAKAVTPWRRRGTMLVIAFIVGNTIVQSVVALPHLVQYQRYTNDAVAVTDCAAHLAMQGGNPYKNVHMLSCLQNHGLNSGATTPKQAGAFKQFRSYPSPAAVTYKWIQYITFRKDLAQERLHPDYMTPDFENRFNYPGAAISLAIPALLLGLRDLIPLYLACIVVCGVLIYRKAGPAIRPIVALLLLGNTALVIDGIGGTTDAMYALFLVIYWFNRDRVLLAGLLLGLAMASRQQAWFFAPYLLYLGWRTGGWRDLWQRAGLMLAVFVGFNAQFFLMSPGDWVAGVLGPMRDPLFALGVGFIELSIAKIIPLMPSTVYLVLEAIAYVAAFAFFVRYCTRWPALALLLPLIPMAFAWRSLHSYFMFLPVFALAALVTTAAQGVRARQPAVSETEPARKARSTYRIITP